MAKKSASRQVDRSAKLVELRQVVVVLNGRIEEIKGHREHRELLQSVTTGLYDETDKLCKKAPAEQVTDLLLEQVNQVIGETKEIIKRDPYVQRLNQFVAAGDNPEIRDVVVILRQVQQALDRFAPFLNRTEGETRRKLKEAGVLGEAIEQFQLDATVLMMNVFEDDAAKAAEDWFDQETELFDFDRLDETPLKDHFGLE